MSGMGEGVSLVYVIFVRVGSGVTVCESGSGPGGSKIPDCVVNYW